MLEEKLKELYESGIKKNIDSLEEKRLVLHGKINKEKFVSKVFPSDIVVDAAKNTNGNIVLFFDSEEDARSMWDLLGKYRSFVKVYRSRNKKKVVFYAPASIIEQISETDQFNNARALQLWKDKNLLLEIYDSEKYSLEDVTIGAYGRKPPYIIPIEKQLYTSRLTFDLPFEYSLALRSSIYNMYWNFYDLFDILFEISRGRYFVYEKLEKPGKKQHHRWRLFGERVVINDRIVFWDQLKRILTLDGFSFYSSVYNAAKDSRVRYQDRFVIEIDPRGANPNDLIDYFFILQEVLDRRKIKYLPAFSGNKSFRVEIFIDQNKFLEELPKIIDEAKDIVSLYLERLLDEDYLNNIRMLDKAAKRAFIKDVYIHLVRLAKNYDVHARITLNKFSPYPLLDFPGAVSIILASPKAIIYDTEIPDKIYDKMLKTMDEIEITWDYPFYFTMANYASKYLVKNLENAKYLSVFPLAIKNIEDNYDKIKNLLVDETREYNAERIADAIINANEYVGSHVALKKRGESYLF